MKKFVPILLVIFFVASFNNFAQFKLGLTPVTGININLHNGSDLQESGSGFGIFIGGQAHMSFTKSIGMIAGIVFYDNRSGSYSESGTSQGIQYNADVDASLAYFQIETLFKYSLPSNFYLVFGPELGFNVESEATVDINFPQLNQNQKSKTTIKNTQTRFELKAGAGYEIPIAKNIEVVPQVTFGYGLSNVVEDVKWKILTFQASVGVKFDLL